MQLSVLKKGCKSKITGNAFGSDMRRRLSDMGFSKGSEIECVGESLFGDPRAYLVRGSLFALRNADADKIFCL